MTPPDELPAGARPSSKIADTDKLKKLNEHSLEVGMEETLPYDVLKKLDKSAKHRCLWVMSDPASSRSIPRRRTCWEVQLKNGDRRQHMLDLEPMWYETLPND
jgi:hypothetical protein